MLNVALFLLLVIATFMGCTYGQDDGDLRLVDGRTNTSGRVEIFHEGQWGTICDDLFGLNDAAVACNQLGLGDMKAQVMPDTPPGSGLIFLDNLDCSGDEFTLAECRHAGWGVHNCGHHEDVGVECDTQSFADVMRLVDGPFTRSGRLEVRYAREWRPVCGDGFGQREAEVACRTLGFQSNTPIGRVISGIDYQAWLERAYCQGNETSMSECTLTGPFFYDDWCYSNIELHCMDFNDNVIANAGVRLTGGSSISGRLEISLSDVWGTVCDDYFDARDARVACRMLNLPTTFATHYRYDVTDHYQESMPIFLDDLTCNGTETSLFQCGHGGILDHNCYQYENVGVFCTDDEHATHHHEVRLVGSNNTNTGRVEVQYYGIWGTVCNTGWGSADTRVLCRSLNLPYGYAREIFESFGGETGPVWLNNVACNGDEPSLFACQHRSVGSTTCFGIRPVAVICE